MKCKVEQCHIDTPGVFCVAHAKRFGGAALADDSDLSRVLRKALSSKAVRILGDPVEEPNVDSLST